MQLQESEELQALRAAVRAVAEQYGHRAYARHAAEREPMHDLWADLGEAGFLGVGIPEEHGGGGGGMAELAVVCEELGAAGTPILLIVVALAIAVEVLVDFGSDEQQAAWLPGIASGHRKIAFAITEPEAGTNTFRLSTTVARAGDGWVLNGTKHYISGFDEADAVLVVARDAPADGHAPADVGDDAARPSFSLLLVPTDAPGIRADELSVDIMLPERQFTLFFDDVALGPDAIVGEPGDGFRMMFRGLNPERITGAALGVGVARHVLERAARYANEREVWGQPIGSHQAVAHPLARAHVANELCALMTHRAAALHDAGLPAGEEANMAKFAASEAGMQAVDAAVQTHGGNGLASEYGLLPYWGLARLMKIAPLNNEMILNQVAQHGLGLPRSYGV